MRRRPLRTVDADRGLRVRLVVLLGSSMMFLLISAEAAWGHGNLLLFAIPDAVATGATIWLVWRTIERGATGAGALLFPSGRSTPRSHEHSEQDALVARGLYRDAVDSYRSRIVASPDDIEARHKLGALLAGECADPAAAVACLLEIRRQSTDANDHWRVTNALIDIYRGTGDSDALRTELRRIAREHPRTTAGRNAWQHAADPDAV